MLTKIKQWIADNTFNIENHAGVKYEVIDVDEINKMFEKWESDLDSVIADEIEKLIINEDANIIVDLKVEILKFLSESDVRDFELNKKFWIHKIDKYLKK
jgi:uncharacterized protein YegJ (DUF2314 family)